MGKTCCFIGHSDAPESIYPALSAAVKTHIVQFGVTEFLVGNYGAFDRMAAHAVGEAKKEYPEVSQYLMLAYLPRPGSWVHAPSGIDGTIFPEGLEKVPHKLAIPRLNRIMVQEADHVISYVIHSWGGAAKSLEYARVRERRGELKICNLGK